MPYGQPNRYLCYSQTALQTDCREHCYWKLSGFPTSLTRARGHFHQARINALLKLKSESALPFSRGTRNPCARGVMILAKSDRRGAETHRQGTEEREGGGGAEREKRDNEKAGVIVA